MRPDDVIATLRDIVGVRHVLTDPDTVAGQVVDWTGRFRGSTLAVVRPHVVDEVAAVLRTCNDAGVAVVAQGGNTGLVGGSVPLHGELLLDLRHLREMTAVDTRAGQVTAQAGVTLAQLQAHANASGWLYGVDLSARDTATVGGMIATNAGGTHVLRYGSTRRQVAGIEAVLADGSVLRRLEGLDKDNTGYDLPGLFCGSEGTLAVVTAARLRLVPRPAYSIVTLLAFDGVDAALDAVGTLRQGLDDLHAVELFFQDGLDLVCDMWRLTQPFDAPHVAFVLVEAAGGSDPTESLAACVASLPGVADNVVAADAVSARALWRYREGHTDVINLVGTPLKLDVTVPLDALASFVTTVRRRVAAVAPSSKVWLFGHAADGNLHVNVTGVDPNDDRVTAAVLECVAELHGSISAEHGIGSAKRRWLHLVRSPEEIATMRAIKDALDPRGTLNPHVLLPPADGDS
jgi:FAD/FMN-containing dehydrogenase